MKNIYRLLFSVILCLCTYYLQAQSVDTTGLQRNENGKVSFAHVSNAKMDNAINFLKTVLQTKSNDSFVLEKKKPVLHFNYKQKDFILV